MPYNPKKNGAANYKSWMQLTAAQIAALQSIEGSDNTSDPNAEQFAQVVHVINSISGGSGAIADGTDSALLATVFDLTSSNPQAVAIVNANGDQEDRLQTYGTYDTDSYQNLDGSSASAQSTAFGSDTLVRVKAYYSDCWIKLGTNPTAVDSEGMLLSEYDDLTLTVLSGDKIAVIGGKLNIVPVT